MATQDQRSLPSIKVQTNEPKWNCKCKPEVNCRLVIELPPPAPRDCRFRWIIRPGQSVAPVPEGNGSSSSSAPIKKRSKEATKVRSVVPKPFKYILTRPSRPKRTALVSSPSPIETLDKKGTEESEEGSEWEEVDELKDDSE